MNEGKSMVFKVSVVLKLHGAQAAVGLAKMVETSTVCPFPGTEIQYKMTLSTSVNNYDPLRVLIQLVSSVNKK